VTPSSDKSASAHSGEGVASASPSGLGLGVIAARDPEALLQGVAAAVGEALDLSTVDLWTFAPDTDTLRCRAFWSRESSPTGGMVGAVVSLDQSHDLRRLVLTAEVVERHVDDDLTATEAAALQQRGFLTRIDVPLLAGAEVLGIVTIADAQRVRRLTDEERAQLRGLCRLAAVVLRTTDLYEHERDRGRHLRGLLQSGRSLVGHRIDSAADNARSEVERLLHGMTCETEVVQKQEHGSFAFLPASGGELRPWEADALARQAVELQQPEQGRLADGTARLVVPLVVAGATLGLLQITAHLRRRFRDDEIEMIRLLADQTAAAFAAARAYQALENRSATDSITGLYSRWYYYERLYAEVARGRRYVQPLSVIVAELDGYEQLVAEMDETHRNAVLSGLARAFRGSLRDRVDVAFRLGGGRFALLLPNTPGSEAGACLVAERVRATLEEARLQDDDLGALGRYTVSLGVAEFPRHAEDADDLAAAAQEAARQAAAAGGNRVVLSDATGGRWRPLVGAIVTPIQMAPSCESASSAAGSPAVTCAAAPATRAVIASAK
jgi:diguanylate cyclase (GGDEF)-like protein